MFLDYFIIRCFKKDAGVGKDALCLNHENQTGCIAGQTVKNGNGEYANFHLDTPCETPRYNIYANFMCKFEATLKSA